MKKIFLIIFISLGLIGSANAASSDDYDLAVSAYENEDYQTAFKGFSVLAKKTGNLVAQEWLGYMYEFGEGVTKDYKQAVYWYRKAADRGSEYAQNKLGVMYEDGTGVTKDYKQAVNWYRKAANRGYDFSQNNLGFMYAEGKGVAQDFKQAVSWFRKAANQGLAIAQNNLGYMYEDGNGVTKDYKQAVNWFRKAANQEYADAQNNLGRKYEYGEGVVQDYKLSVSWYRKAANQGLAIAQSNLGFMYSEGNGVAQDYKQAVSWYRKSANQGNDFGQYNLGFMYQNGSGVTKDYKQAASWYRKSADQGNVYAEEWLGYTYEFGQGVTQDYNQAFKWYQKAAKQGSRYSQNQLGTMYENGTGVSQNDKLALNWYRKASDQGDLNAKKNLKALELSSGIKASEAKKIATKDEMETIKNDNNIVSSNATLEYHSIELEFWRSVQNSDNLEEYLIYLKKYPKGHFTELAELRINSSSTSTNQLSAQNFEYGNYYALVIGNDNYKHLKPLENAVNDANDVTSLLRSKYQFKVDVLANATRDEIVSALSDLRNSVSAKDNILIYYAGHGYLDKEMDEGFWLPVDATDDNQVHWIANDTIMRNVRAMKAKHVMIVADSCFSGTLTRGIKIANTSSDYIKEIVKKKARTVLTSGGLEPVSDVGGGNNSVFAESFLNILNENKGVMNGNELFIEIRKQVMQNTKDQTPEYGDIRKAGHDGGDFLFVSQ